MPTSQQLSSADHIELTSKGFSALLSAAVDGMIIIDSKGNILNFNIAAERMFDYKANEVINQNVKMLMPSPYKEEHDGYLHNYNSTGEAKIIGLGRRVEAQRKDKSVFPIELSVGEYKDGQTQYFVGIIRDLTERDRVEKELKISRDRLRETDRQLAHVDRINTMGEMASGIAHEVNQPLTAISSYIQACLRRLDSGGISAEKFRELLIKINDQSLRAGEIVRRIRSLIRPHERLRERTETNELVADAIMLAKADANSRKIVLKVEHMPDNCEIIADSIQIQQVILNLIRNALDATEEANPSAGRVIVGMDLIENGDYLKFWVRDFGYGIADDLSDHIFEAFVTSKLKGTGMGLSVSRTIINAHGGELWYEVKEPGIKFIFTIPTAVSDVNYNN
jgi:two-component system sensor kinase FixL